MAVFNLSNGNDIFGYWDEFVENAPDYFNGPDLVYGNGGNDFLAAGNGSDTVYGGSGNDELFSSSFYVIYLPEDGDTDYLYGGSGDDGLYGDNDNDFIDGGVGIDYMNGSYGDDIYYVDNQFDSVIEQDYGGDFDIVISSVTYTLGSNVASPLNFVEALTLTGSAALNGTGNGLANTITGNAGTNTLNGLGGNDFIAGGEGNDQILGGSGNDEMTGEMGNDTIRGQGGNDILRGAFGADVLIGGSGNDAFQFLIATASPPGGRDTIAAGDGATAFQGAGAAAGDRIDVSAIFGGVLTFGGRLTLANSGTNTIVRANTDADAAIEFELAIQDGAVLASAYRASDFIL